MRKCPNCKKAVPVGARRCVYCRMLIADSTNEAPINSGQNSMTQMGFGNAKEDDFDSNNSTSLGLPGGNFAPNIGSADKRSIHHFDVNEAPHQTMIGLGPITSNSSRNVGNPAKDTNSGMHTIAGMPGVSFDPSEVAAFKARLTPMRNTPIRPSQAVLNTPNEAPVNIPKGIRRSNVNMTPVAQPTPSRSTQTPIPSAQSAIPKSQPALKPQSQVNQPAVAQPAPAPSAAAAAPKTASNDNLLAGLPGVAPVPSSLVDEEFVDLTSKVFGSDFAGVNESFDDEEDGLDFDFPSAPEKPQQPAAQKAPAPAPAPAPQPQVIPIPSIPQPKANIQPAAPAKPKTVEPAQPAAKAEPAPEPKKIVEPLPAQEEIPLRNASGGTMDYITLILAMLSAVACIAWLAFAAISLSTLTMLAGATILSIIIDGIYFPLRNKIKPVMMTLIFLIALIVLFLAFFTQRSVMVSKFVYFIAMGGQFLTTICCFFRKS